MVFKTLICSVLSGVMLTASFPPSKLDWIAWFALIPLFKSLDNVTPAQAFKLGFIAGLSHYLTLIYWIVVVLESYGGLNLPISFCVLLLLCLYLSLYLAVFSYLFFHFRISPFGVLMAACIWVGLEFIRANVLTGFPWCLLGYTQFRRLYLIQIADMTGVYGVSFLLVLSNALIFMLFFSRNREKRVFLKWETALLVLIAFFTLTYSHYRLTAANGGEKKRRAIKVALIQGNIDQSLKWNPAYQGKTLGIYHRLTRSTAGFKPQLVVWPETAVPFFFQDNRQYSPKIIKMAKESQAHLVFGSPAYRRTGHGVKYFNRAYILSPGGELSGYYDKVHLVPFGEYVPLKKFLPFVHRLVPAAGDFVSGEKAKSLKLSLISAGILICFEVIFPELARTQVKEGAGILINLTNDAWFGMTSAPHQHLSMAVFRAVENGRPLIRAANTGYSGFITHRGEITKHGNLFIEEVLKEEVSLGDDSIRFYTRYGDLFSFVILVISLIKIFHVLCYNKFRSRVQGSEVR